MSNQFFSKLVSVSPSKRPVRDLQYLILDFYTEKGQNLDDRKKASKHLGGVFILFVVCVLGASADQD